MKNISFLFIMALSINLYAYDKPNSIAYNAIEKAYYITNLAGKTVTKLDSNFDKTDIITGLKQPKDILFATFGPYRGLLILDSNEVKVYDADSFSFIASFEVPGAIDLEDAEADKLISNIFYISDPKAHKIFKVEIGAAPFYIPSFTVLNSTVRNPKALLFDSKNRLLVTTDTIKSGVYNINLINGNATLINYTAIDNINSIEEDLEGNFYATSWGDSYFYRLDKNFKNAKDLALYSKPTGLFFNKVYDVIVIACSNCNKVEFYKLHMIYINDIDTAKCPSDSFNVNVSLQFKGKGTYNTGNAFYVELSDGNGKFSGATVIGSVKSTVEPNSYRVLLPNNKRFYGSKFSIRVRSTNPAFYSINQMETVVPFATTIYVSDKDTIFYCSSKAITIGRANEKDDSLLVNYLWYKDGKKISNNTSQLVVQQSGIHQYKLIKQPHIFGCKLSDSVVIEQKGVTEIEIPFKDTVAVCQGDAAIIGGDSIANTSVVWTDMADQTVLSTQFKFIITGNIKNTNRQLKATLKSLTYGCENNKEVKLLYKNKPLFEVYVPINPGFCSNKIVTFNPELLSGDTQNMIYKWEPSTYLSNPSSLKPVYQNPNNQNKFISYKFSYSDSITQCGDSNFILINNLKYVDKPILKQISMGSDTVFIQNYDSDYIYNYTVFYKDNSKSVLFNTKPIFKLQNLNEISAIVVTVLNNNCITESDSLKPTILIGIIPNLKKQTIIVYPNPSNNLIKISSSQLDLDNAEVQIIDINGQLIMEKPYKNLEEINIGNLKPGVYFINANFEGRNYQSRFIKY